MSIPKVAKPAPKVIPDPASVSRDKTKAALIAVYKLYTKDNKKYEGEFYKAILAFAKLKIAYIEYEFFNLGTAGTVDDYAQESAIAVFKGLKKFRGNSESFYAWVHKICYTTASGLFNELHRQKVEKVAIFLEEKGDDGEGSSFVEENPLLSARFGSGGNGHRRVDDILANVDGTDKWICQLIMDGNTQKQVAGLLHMGEAAVKARLHRMKVRFTKEKDVA